MPNSQSNTEEMMTQLALTPQFIAQTYRMPKHVQKGLAKFYQEFPKDTKAETWHVEPIGAFRDPNLRTARVNIQYRLVLRIPFDGDHTWYLLWVDNHDEAMAWAENKMVEWNNLVQAVQVYDVAEAQAALKVEEPQVSYETPAHPLEGVDDEQLMRIGVPEVLIPSVRKIRDFYDVDRIQRYIPEGVYENLLHLFAGDPIDNLIRDVEEGRVESEDFHAQKRSANNRRGILELTGEEELDEALLGDFAAWRVFLHPSQRILAEGDFSGPVKVTGGAGTGKTVAALHRAKYLSEHGEGLILFTTFTKSLTQSLEDDLRALGANMTQVRVANLDALGNQLAREFGLVAGRLGLVEFTQKEDLALGIMENKIFEAGLQEQFSPQEMLKEYRDIILEYDCETESDYRHVARTGRGFRLGKVQRAQIWAAVQAYEAELHGLGYKHLGRFYNELVHFLRSNPDKVPFRHVVADEIQDLGLVKLRMLRALAPAVRNDLFLVGDPLQKIYPGDTNFSKARIEVRGRRSRKLKINYRTTEQIRRYALQPILQLDFEDFDGELARKDGYISLRSGAVPSYELFDATEKEMEWVLEKVRAYTGAEAVDPVRPSEIAVACARSKTLKDWTSAFHQAGVPYYQFSGIAGKGNREGVVLSTMHSLKGHEYKIVFLTGISEDTYPGRPTGYQEWPAELLAEHDKRQAALLYVACSRAVWRLHLSGVGKGCGMVGAG
ncbi:MAG: DEAD/DEAH box helicase [Lewinellaceae bacterium]|nr:DEAD/DEAH box helicase [Lewinellaceae bacterium]